MTAKHRKPTSHTSSAEQALHFARLLCEEKKLRFTPLRQLVLETLWQIDSPIKAYDLIEQLQHSHGRVVNPPSIYRALDFLYSNGLIHRIESLNAFAACHDNQDFHEGQFIICNQCGHVQEVHEDDVMDELAGRLRKIGFQMQRQTVELRVDCIKKNCPRASSPD